MIALNPKSTVDFTLPVHEDLPEAERPVFRTRHLTANELCEVCELARQSDGPITKEKILLLAQACAIGLVGWRNVRRWEGDTPRDVAFSAIDAAGPAEWLAANATFQEINALYMARLQAIRLKIEEKKSSEPPPPSGPASGAPDASPAASASTSPASGCR